MIAYIILFVLFSVLGGVLDAVYCSITSRKYCTGTLIPYFSALYGLGGLLLVFIFTHFQASFWKQVIAGGIAITFLELSASIFCMTCLKRRFWNYSSSRYNFQGHIDLLHTFFWFVISFLMRLIFSSFNT
ncbi:MAG: hypothetical protein HY363_03285 [Candidatus Aenigmarchaeota archaeon]|nr:hypothetical protein [Candidatus Aenigmarchaeota archaeon]